MTSRARAALLPSLCAIALAACHPGTQVADPRTAKSAKPVAKRFTGTVSKVGSDEEYAVARAEFEALDSDDPSRAARRRAILDWLLPQARRALDGAHLEDGLTLVRQSATLFDPSELRKPTEMSSLLAVAAQLEKVARRRGAREETTLALVLQLSSPVDAERHAADARYRQLTRWLSNVLDTTGDKTFVPTGKGREHAINDLEAAARVWPSPLVVDELTRLYLARAGDPLADLLADSQRAVLVVNLTRLYLRAGRAADLAPLYKQFADRAGDDARLRALVDKAYAPTAQAGDAVALAKGLVQASGTEADREVALQICREATQRFPSSLDPHLCTGELAFEENQLGLAIRSFEEAKRVQPDRQETWEVLARLYRLRLSQVVSDENVDVKNMEAQLAKVERFHAEAKQRFVGKQLRISMAEVLYDVGRGYYNSGHLGEARRYLERTLALEPSVPGLELLGQLRLKRGEPREAAALFERAMTLPQEDGKVRLYLSAKLRRLLGDALESSGDKEPAERARRAAVEDWDHLLAESDLRKEAAAEAALERAKLLYQLGERDESLESFRQAIDIAPDLGSSYADSIAFLIPRGELESALDSYHRALGRSEVTDYLKVYCSLWIVDLAERAGQPPDPLAQSYLRSTDGAKWYHDLARWATAREADDALMRRADTPARRAEASFYRAMRAVGRGQLDEAKRLWREVLATEMVAFFEYDMASYYLKLGRAPEKPVIQRRPSTPRRPMSPTPSRRPPDGSI